MKSDSNESEARARAHTHTVGSQPKSVISGFENEKNKSVVVLKLKV